MIILGSSDELGETMDEGPHSVRANMRMVAVPLQSPLGRDDESGECWAEAVEHRGSDRVPPGEMLCWAFT